MLRARPLVLLGGALFLLAGTAARADEPKAKIEGVEDDDLARAIRTAVGDSEKKPTGRFDARRRARAAGEDAIAVLRSEGYYAYSVEADVDDGDPPQPVVRIEPGPLFTFGAAGIEWTTPAPSEAVQGLALKAMDLKAGDPGRAAAVLAAEGRIVAVTQKAGYADATAQPREVLVDHADHSVKPTFRIAAGDLVHLDGLHLITKGRSNPAWVEGLAPWRTGDVYDPEDVAELERRLLDTGVYESVTVALAPKDKTTPEGLRPIVVSLADRKPRTIELGASYSTTEGIGLDARYVQYNRLRRGDTTTYSLRLADIDSRLQAQIALPHWRRPQQTLTLTGAIFNNVTDAYDETGASVVADLTKRWRKTSFLTWGVELNASQTTETDVAMQDENLRRNLYLLAGLGALSLDRSDDPLNPKRGWRIEVRGEPTVITGDTSLVYLKTQAQGSVYFPFGEQARTVVAGRLKLGAIFNGAIPQLPAARRFYSGGGGSVRGYGYQAIGPRLDDNSPQGGLSLFESSLELRQQIVGKWGAVAFVDVGAVGTHETPSLGDFSAGAGIGVRYDLGFGPIRADIAVPLEKREGDAAFQVYLSIGQSF